MDYAIYYALVYQSQLGCSFFLSLSVLSVLSTSIFRFDSFCFQMPGMASSIVFFFFWNSYFAERLVSDAIMLIQTWDYGSTIKPIFIWKLNVNVNGDQEI